MNSIEKANSIAKFLQFDSRHLCEQGDNLEQYGWREHDGKNFGVQVIIDKFIQLETSFVTKLGGNHGGDWSAKIHVEPRVRLSIYP